MTEQEYQSTHGAELRVFLSTPAGAHLLVIAESKHPVRSIPQGDENLGYRTNGAVAYLGEITGYERAMALLRTLSSEPNLPPPEVPDTFDQPEI